MRSQRPSALGFTLVELTITLAVLAVLTAIAWPAYQDIVRKGRRSDAMAAISNVMQAQERYRSASAAYEPSIGQLSGVSALSPGGHYTLALTGATTGSRYAVTATVSASSPQSADRGCATLTVTVDGGSISYSSTDAGGNPNATPDPCWVK